MNIDKDFCQANAIKYFAGLVRKMVVNRKDLLKAIHYVILLMSSEDKDDMATKQCNSKQELYNKQQRLKKHIKWMRSLGLNVR